MKQDLFNGNDFFKSINISENGMLYKSNSLEDKLLNFLKKNKNPSDKQIHNFAKQNKMDPDKLEEVVYKILSTFLTGGLAEKKGMTSKDVDQKELAMGIKVEMEHLNSKSPFAKKLAERIAVDHLSEKKNYYSMLKKVEGE